MTGRPRRAPPDPTSTYVPGTLLDWRTDGRSHWSENERPCRYCGGLTNLRDSKRSPAHKVCAEDALARQAAEAAEAYQIGTSNDQAVRPDPQGRQARGDRP